jgi:hypothetical protein
MTLWIKLYITYVFIIAYATYNNKNAIIRANNPVASANANPNIAYENNWPLKLGFLDTPKINAPNTTPIPTPAPIRPVVAKPVPIILAACIKSKEKEKEFLFKWLLVVIDNSFYFTQI